MVIWSYVIYLSCFTQGDFVVDHAQAWWIWKLRNAVVYDAAILNTASLSDMTRDEACSWASAGAIGIRALIPTAV
jgi:hypothetical protein